MKLASAKNVVVGTAAAPAFDDESSARDHIHGTPETLESGELL